MRGGRRLRFERYDEGSAAQIMHIGDPRKSAPEKLRTVIRRPFG